MSRGTGAFRCRSFTRSSSAAEARVLPVHSHSAAGRLTRSSSAAEARVLAVHAYSAAGRLTRSSSAAEARVLAVPAHFAAGHLPVAVAQRRLGRTYPRSSHLFYVELHHELGRSITITSYEGQAVVTCEWIIDSLRYFLFEAGLYWVGSNLPALSYFPSWWWHLNLDQWLGQAIKRGASDVHLIAGYPPTMRLHGVLLEVESLGLTPEILQEQLQAICPAPKREQLNQQRSCDFSHELQVDGQERRLRANLYYADGSLSAAFRVIPSQIPDWQWAGISPALGQRLVFQKDGLVIITGATGAGKSTTLAMLTNLLNEAGGYRIITIEEPIEYRFPKGGRSIISQREVGVDVISFAEGLRSGLRQDPDVIVVGEIRDTETAQMALSAAETGHLVLATMHTRDTKGAISRYADFFPLETQRDMRNQFALSLRAIVSQRLLPGQIEGAKRYLALEVLWNTSPIFSAIRNNKLESIDNYLLTGRDEGMISFDESIRQLYREGKISQEVAESHVRDRAFLTR